MKNIQWLICLIIPILGCNGYATEKQVVGDYYLIATDVNSDLTLSIRLENGDYLGVVDPIVKEIGFDNNFILGMRQSANSSTHSYFIAPIKINEPLWAKEAVYSEMTYDQFQKKMSDLGISSDVCLRKVD